MHCLTVLRRKLFVAAVPRAVILRRERALASEPRRMAALEVAVGLSPFEARRAKRRAELLRVTVQGKVFVTQRA
jgi:hypothetical protein